MAKKKPRQKAINWPDEPKPPTEVLVCCYGCDREDTGRRADLVQIGWREWSWARQISWAWFDFLGRCPKCE